MISCDTDDSAQQGNGVARPLMPTPADVLVGTHEDETRSVGLTITFIRIEYDLEGNAQRFGCLLELPAAVGERSSASGGGGSRHDGHRDLRLAIRPLL